MGLRVVIVGCGKIADGHVEEIRKLKNAEVVAVSDVEPLMAEQIAVRYHVPRHYSNFHEMLDIERPDVVHITTPPASHLELATAAIESGSHVFVEKPLGLNYEETSKLVRFAAKSGRKLTVGWSYVLDPPMVALRRLVRRGLLGDPVHIESFYGYSLDGLFGKAVLENDRHWVLDLPGRLLQNNIDHALNKLTEFIDDDEPDVSARGYVRRPAAFGDVRDEFCDELRATVVGREVSAYVTFSSHARPAAHFLRVYGSNCTAHVDFLSRTVTIDGGPTLPTALGRLVPAFSQSWQYFREGWRNAFRFARSDFHYFAGLNRLIAAFYGSIISNSKPPIHYRDILRVAWMTDRIVEQVEHTGVDNRR